MNSLFLMVMEFHRAFGAPAPDAPCLLPPDRRVLRDRLEDEEKIEYEDAVASGNMEAISEELVDRVYVLLGRAVEHGLVRFDEMFAEKHRANMAKMWPDGSVKYREDGKVLKPPGWEKPDMDQFLG